MVDELSILEDNNYQQENRIENMLWKVHRCQLNMQVLQSGDELRKFAEVNGHQELLLATSKVNYLISQIKQSSSQTNINECFSAVEALTFL